MFIQHGNTESQTHDPMSICFDWFCIDQPQTTLIIIAFQCICVCHTTVFENCDLILWNSLFSVMGKTLLSHLSRKSWPVSAVCATTLSASPMCQTASKYWYKITIDLCYIFQMHTSRKSLEDFIWVKLLFLIHYNYIIEVLNSSNCFNIYVNLCKVYKFISFINNVY